MSKYKYIYLYWIGIYTYNPLYLYVIVYYDNIYLYIYHIYRYLHELRVNINTNTTSIHSVNNTQNVEFPRVHPLYIGRPTQYGFISEMEYPSHKKDILGVFTRILKIDLFRKVVVGSIVLPEGCTTQEVIPVPRPLSGSGTGSVESGSGSDGSDNVYLVGFVFNDYTNIGELHVYDGYTMSQEPVTVLTVPGVRVPYGFHSEWLSEDQLQRHLAQAVVGDE